MNIYPLLKPLLFQLDAEQAHGAVCVCVCVSVIDVWTDSNTFGISCARAFVHEGSLSLCAFGAVS